MTQAVRYGRFAATSAVGIYGCGRGYSGAVTIPYG